MTETRADLLSRTFLTKNYYIFIISFDIFNDAILHLCHTESNMLGLGKIQSNMLYFTYAIQRAICLEYGRYRTICYTSPMPYREQYTWSTEDTEQYAYSTEDSLLSSGFSCIYEANASELVDSSEEMFSR